MLLREGIEYHDLADTINGQFRTCALGVWRARMWNPDSRIKVEQGAAASIAVKCLSM
jgi:hypothetical protein